MMFDEKMLDRIFAKRMAYYDRHLLLHSVLWAFFFFVIFVCVIFGGAIYYNGMENARIYTGWSGNKLRIHTLWGYGTITHISYCKVGQGCRAIRLKKTIHFNDSGNEIIPQEELERLGVKPGDDVTGWYYDLDSTTPEQTK